MTGIRFLEWLLAIATLVAIASSVAHSKSLGELLEDEGLTITTANEKLLAEFSAYYREHAKVRLGKESRLANGVAWRLLTDVRTGLSAPRLTWMSDRDSLKRANALFEAVHGELLVRYELQDIEYRTRMLYDREDGNRPYFMIGPPFRKQMKVAVTYASARLVSYVETGMEYKATSFWLEVRGLVLDLERGRISTIEACKEKRKGGFRLGELLDVCDDQSLERFIAIWVNRIETAMEKARNRSDELSVQCGESMYPLEWKDRVDPTWIDLYLTPSGIAVFNRRWNPNVAKFCAFYDITVNPIVIPYRELEPFMKPGSWRDELLR